jgi:carbon-monoxide dehydrogenase large subunit
MHRKEDARFIRGHGNYVDDVNLPGMLRAVLRSPTHARCRSIDTSAAEAHPKSRPSSPGRLSRSQPRLDADPLL